MTRICNFPISKTKRCTQPVANGRPNCGRHRTNLSAEQLGQDLTVYRKGGALHIWAGDPDGLYCLIHGDPAYQALCQLTGEKIPYCLNKMMEYRDKDGELHREDGPAVIWPDGTRHWYWHGKPHRGDGPAKIRSDGKQEWYWHGERHRDDGPAEIWANGEQFWYQYGELHREDGPAWIEPDGKQRWYRRGEWIVRP